MSFHDDSENDAPEFTAEMGVVLSIAAALVTMLVAQLLALMTGDGLTGFGIGTIVGYGGALFVARPFIAAPPEIGLRPAPARAWIAAVLLVPVPLLVSELENLVHAYLVPRPPAPDLPERLPVERIQELLVTVAVLPVMAELFFRGFLQPRLTPFWGPTGAWLGASALAAAAWLLQLPSIYTVRGLILVLPVVLLLGLLRRVSGSIFPGLLLGVAVSFAQFGAGLEWFGIPGFDLTGDRLHTPLTILALPAAMTGVALALLRGRAAPPEERKPRERRRRLQP
jgi:membrane protease YdiL (CAAX protease family)